MLCSTQRAVVLGLLSLIAAGCGGGSAKDGSAFQHDKAAKLFLDAMKVRATDQDQALELLNQSIDARPAYNTHFHRAWIYALRGEDAKAIEDINAGLSLEPESKDLKWLDGEMKKPAKQRKLDMPPPPVK